MKKLLTVFLSLSSFICNAQQSQQLPDSLKVQKFIEQNYPNGLELDDSLFTTFTINDKLSGLCMTIEKGDTTIYDSACVIRTSLEQMNRYSKENEQLRQAIYDLNAELNFRKFIINQMILLRKRNAKHKNK